MTIHMYWPLIWANTISTIIISLNAIKCKIVKEH